MNLAWLLLLVGLALARVDITVPMCYSMSVERNGEHWRFAATFDLTDNAGSESLVPVLGFTPYVDGRLGSRDACSNVHAGTSAQNLAEALRVSSASYEGLVAQNGWSKTRDAGGLTTMSLEITPEALDECLLSSQEGMFYISLVRLSYSADEGYSDYSVYTQPHHFDLTGEVHTVAPMRWMFGLAWVSNTWTAEGNAVMTFVSNLSSPNESGLEAHIESAEFVSASSEGLTLVAISECDAAVSQYCAQQWLFMSTGAPTGSYRLEAHVQERVFGPSTTFSVLMDLDVAPNEQRSGSVEVQAFVDEAMQLPYLAAALNGSVLRDGETVCLLLQDNDGHAIRARAARMCTSASGTLHSESGAADSGCNTPGLDDIIEAIIFDTDERYVSREMKPAIQQLESVAHQAFCFSALKLSENNHVVEIEYEEPSEPGVFGRQLQSFGYDNENCHHQMYIECQSEYHWDGGCGCCQQSYKHTTHYDNSEWVWLGFILFLIVVGIAACLTSSDCFHWDGSSSGTHHHANDWDYTPPPQHHHPHDYVVDVNDSAHLHKRTLR